MLLCAPRCWAGAQRVLKGCKVNNKHQAARPGDGRAITSQLQQVLERFVATDSGRPLRLIHMGDIPADLAVRDAVMRRQLLLLNTPGCPAALAISQLAGKIEETLLARAG